MNRRQNETVEEIGRKYWEEVAPLLDRYLAVADRRDSREHAVTAEVWARTEQMIVDYAVTALYSFNFNLFWLGQTFVRGVYHASNILGNAAELERCLRFERNREIFRRRKIAFERSLKLARVPRGEPD
ncbi:MAG: hypothetical protein KJ600_02465 [Nanoarchaeota archaeon]|nr:hypothetical protein [Nanoarchaeota archaeon]MBU1103397.1 hypothetical protein [Nanoarchaeota archaeon]